MTEDPQDLTDVQTYPGTNSVTLSHPPTGIPDERLQEILESKDADLALSWCQGFGYSESWSIIDGCVVIYSLDAPPKWLQPVLAARDEDGNTDLA